VVTHVVQAELHDQGLVRELGLHEVDAAIVGIEHVEASIVNTMLLLEAGVPYVVVRAHTSLHGRILERLGAHRVIYPEAHSGEAAARSLHAPDVIEHIELGPGLSINKLRAPSAWVGRRPDDLRRGDQGSFIVLVIQRGEETIVMPNADACIKEGDILALLARESALSKLPRDLQRRR
jgi:trk system potassium uptake protein TrkA